MSHKRTNIIVKAQQAPDYFRWLHKLSPKARRRYEAACDRADRKRIHAKLQDNPAMETEITEFVRRFREQIISRALS